MRKSTSRLNPFTLPLLLALAGLLLTGCLQPPVENELHLDFQEDLVVITQTTRLNSPEEGSGNPSVEERLERLRRDIESQQDDWSAVSRRFRPDREELTLKREQGRLTAVERTMELDDVERICAVFALTDVTCTLQQSPHWYELTLFANQSSRAGRSQEKKVKGILDAFAGAFLAYLETLDPLLELAESTPSRKAVIVGALLKSEDIEDSDLTDIELKHFQHLEDAKNKVLELMMAGPTGYTPAEEVSLVFDPFPAATSVQVEKTILQEEGFVRHPQDESLRFLQRPGLAAAIKSLDGKWLSPAPLGRELNAALTGRQPQGVSLEEAAAIPVRREDIPGLNAFHEHLKTHLTHPPLYRLRWQKTGTAPSPAP